MNRRFFIVAVALLVAGLAFLAFNYFYNSERGERREGEINTEIKREINLEGINFSELGYIRDDEPQNPNRGMSLLYEEPGAPALLVKLVFDADSMCTFTERSTNCMLLSSIMETTIGDRRVLVEGIKTGDEVLVRNIAIDKEYDRRFGFLRKITENNQNVLMEIDEVEFLSGEEAIFAGMEDTECGRANISECIPSMNNNFYIRNKDQKTEVYIADKNTKIQIFKNPGSPVLEEVSLQTLVRKFKDPQSYLTSYPFKFILDGATITNLEEQYLP